VLVTGIAGSQLFPKVNLPRKGKGAILQGSDALHGETDRMQAPDPIFVKVQDGATDSRSSDQRS
jgi:hypothetical protein